MKTKTLLKKSIFLVGFLAVLISLGNLAYAMVLDDSPETKLQDKAEVVCGRGGAVNAIETARVPDKTKAETETQKDQNAQQYVPGEVLVKFKEGADPQAVLEEAGVEADDIERVHSIKPVVTKFKKESKLEKDEDGWYWFLGKKYKEEQEIDEINEEMIFAEACKELSPQRQALYRNYKITLDEGVSVEEAVTQLRENPNVEYAYPNYIRKTYGIPNDPMFNEQWALPKINAPEAWDITEGDPSVVITIIDTGVDYNHEDLARNIWVNSEDLNNNHQLDPGEDLDEDGILDYNEDINHNGIADPDDFNGIDDDENGYIDDVRGYDFVSVSSDQVAPGEDPGPRDNDPMDFHGHGTHCSGIAAARTNNGIGVAGTAPRCKIMALRAGFKAPDGHGYLSDYDIEKAIEYAVTKKAKVISMSFGGGHGGAYMDEIHLAYVENIVLVAAAGNTGSSEKIFPAAMDEVISVAATDANDNKASFSTWGLWVDVAAPGVNILSILPDNQYDSWSGTSMACPHVAGLAALIATRYPDYTNGQIRWLLKETVQGLPQLEGMFFPGFGIIDAHAALQYPNVPPHLMSYIETYNLDYEENQVTIAYRAEGDDFAHYSLQYKKDDGQDIWHDLVTSDIPASYEQFIWDISGIGDGSYLLRIVVATEDEREQKSYESLHIDRSRFYFIRPEIIFMYYYQSNEDAVQGLYRLGDRVPLIGRPFGEYHLEWKKADGPDVWSSDYFDYEVGEGYLGIWDTSSIAEEGIYHIRLVDDYTLERYTEIRLDRNLKEGYPVTLSVINERGRVDGSAIGSRLANVDDDPELEIVTLRNYFYPAEIFVFEADGTLTRSWSVSGVCGNSAYPALADMDGDGIDDILITICGGAGGASYQETIYCFKADGSIIFKRDLPVTDSSVAYMRDPLITPDLNNDSIPEIIYRHDDAIYILDNNGQDLSPVWPKTLHIGYPLPIGDANYMAVGNFDDDRELELVVAQNEGYIHNQVAGNLNIHVFNLDGSYVDGWPNTIEDSCSISDIRCGDMNGDGYDDIVLVADYSLNLLNKQTIYGFSHDGSELFAKYGPNSSYYAIGGTLFTDINDNNNCDFVFGSMDRIDVCDDYGQNFGLWPFILPPGRTNWPNFTSHLAVDIDGDGEIEIVGIRVHDLSNSNTYTMRLVVLTAEGEQESSNPFNDMTVPAGYYTSLHYDDIDADGYGELIIEGNLPVWYESARSYWRYRPCILVYETDTPINPALSHWPTPHHDKNNTNRCEITESNQPPVLDPIGDKQVNEGQTLSFTISATDPDGDELSFPEPDLPEGAEFNDNGDNTATFTWTPTYDQAGEYQVTFTVSDSDLTDSETITITVNNVNRPPVLDLIGNKAIDEGKKLEFKVTATDPDGDALYFGVDCDSIGHMPEGATFIDQTFSWTPNYDQAGTYEFTFWVLDRHPFSQEPYLKDWEKITITVNNVNRAPVIDPVPPQEIDEGEPFSLQLEARDPDGDKLLYTFNSWDISLRGLELSPDGLLTWTPDLNQAGEYTLELIVSDYPDHPHDYIKTYFNVSIKVIEVTTPPEMLYLWNVRNKYFKWRGRDKEDGFRIKYSYRIDREEWSKPTKKRKIKISEVSQGLKPGTHLFEVKAIDSHGAESAVKSVEFTIEANQPPRILSLYHFRTSRGWYFFWTGRDKEDGHRIKYSYRIDRQEWSKPSRRKRLFIKDKKLKPGDHIFEVNAIDKKGLESEIKSIKFKNRR